MPAVICGKCGAEDIRAEVKPGDPCYLCGAKVQSTTKHAERTQPSEIERNLAGNHPTEYDWLSNFGAW